MRRLPRAELAALAFVLLIGAGLMVGSVRQLLAANPGFDPRHLLTVQIKLANDVKDSKYRAGAAGRRVRGLPARRRSTTPPSRHC
jgi:hypothetical protein